MEKKTIEDLSNLVFGLALTIGAVTLVRPENDDFTQLLSIILNFALGFFVIVWIWFLYNRLIRQLDMDDRSTVVLNTVLLFLVVLEPYLGTIANTRSGATAFAIDVGTTLLILGAFYQFAIIKGRGVGAKVKQLEWGRKIAIVSALIFLRLHYSGPDPGASEPGRTRDDMATDAGHSGGQSLPQGRMSWKMGSGPVYCLIPIPCKPTASFCGKHIHLSRVCLAGTSPAIRPSRAS